MRFRCPNCQNLFGLDSLPASGRTECPSCFQPVKVGVAPGKLAIRNTTMANNEVGILNPRTGSQFQLIHVRNEGFRTVNPEVFIQGLKMRSRSVETNPVQRLSLEGIHFSAEKSINSADAEGEAFPISDGVLIVLYQPGSSLATQKGRDVKYSGQKERELDRVEEYFASLKRN